MINTTIGHAEKETTKHNFFKQFSLLKNNMFIFEKNLYFILTMYVVNYVYCYPNYPTRVNLIFLSQKWILLILNLLFYFIDIFYYIVYFYLTLVILLLIIFRPNFAPFIPVVIVIIKYRLKIFRIATYIFLLGNLFNIIFFLNNLQLKKHVIINFFLYVFVLVLNKFDFFPFFKKYIHCVIQHIYIYNIIYFLLKKEKKQ